MLTHRVPAEVPETSVPYMFVTDGIESAITQAKAAAGDKYVSLAGSQAAQQCLRAGLLDEIWLDVVPLLLGGGVRLFDHIGGPVRLETSSVVDATGVTHLSYRVVEHEALEESGSTSVVCAVALLVMVPRSAKRVCMPMRRVSSS